MIRAIGALPAYLLFPLFVVIGILLTVILDLIVRHWVRPETRERASPTASVTLQVTATIFAILIAFVIVDEYSQLRDTQAQVSAKAADLAVIQENSRAFPGPAGADLRQATLVYARSIVDHGFPRLKNHAEPDPRTDQAIEELFAAVQRVVPADESQRAAYEVTVDGLDGLVRTRQQLINSSRSTIPEALFWLLLTIGLVVMSVAALLDTRHRSSHLFILSALAIVIWLTLALVVSLDYSFSGLIKVTDDPIREFIHFRAAR